jgi:hypothetical protein
MLSCTLVILCGLCGLLGWYYQNHLLWKYTESQGELQDIIAIPYFSMQKLDIPDDWVECSLGCLRFRLPPDLAESEDTSKRTESLAIFNSDIGSVIVALQPVDMSSPDDAFAPLLFAASRFFPGSESPLTVPRVRFECCKHGADDFRWSMSPKEVKRHSFFVNLHALIIPARTTKMVEEFFHDGVDRIILFNGRAMIDWQNTNSSDAGYMHVIDRCENLGMNPGDLARKICQSIRVNCTCSLGNGMTENKTGRE